ncbi:MazG nucleotide pyrophosphohydrolase domain-containing protein [Bernardetia sp. Wsw4-3y2]|uniref:MazG nucleotide pyrophosphohydrolase domain-containing protein n=1 Tax=unclassified Bernardetia TaxID=2647129 RepID=UPI0030CF8895
MPNLPQTNDLKDFQTYIKELCVERGWDKNSPSQLFLLLTEEIGEVAKAIRNHTNLHTQKTQDTEEKQQKTKVELASELADVLNYLLDISNHFDIDLAQAFLDKNKENENREWNS